MKSFLLVLGKKKVVISLSLMLIVLSLLLSLYYAENVPLLDDYGLCLDFLSRYDSTTSRIERLFMIFSFKNGHPIVTQNLLFLLDWTLFGQVNFIHFIIVNNLGHIFLIFFLYGIFRCYSTRLILFIPILLLFAVPVFTLNNWSSSFMHIVTLLFSLSTIFILSKRNGTSFSWALVSAILASISSGSGLLIFVACAPILIRNYSRRAQLVWTLAMCVLGFYYLFNYLSVADNQMASYPFIGNILTYAVNFVVFYGAVFKPLYSDHHVWGVLSGILILFALASLFIKRFNNLLEDPVLLSGIIYSLLLAVVATMMRSQFGMGATTAYRYRFYQMIPLVFLYFSFLSIYKNKMERYLLLFFSFSIVLFGLRLEDSLFELRSRSIQLRNGALVYEYTGEPGQLTSRNQEQAAAALVLSRKKNIYDPRPKDVPRPKMETFGTYTDDLTVIYDRKELNEEYLYLQGWAFLNHNSVPDTEVQVGLVSGGMIHYCQASMLVSFQDPFPNRNEGFSLILPKDKLISPKEIDSIFILIYHPFQGILASKRVDFN